ncbi:MAG: LamG-like jellyroll fold domain-containing protein, partial [Planctomycetota bacterium]
YLDGAEVATQAKTGPVNWNTEGDDGFEIGRWSDNDETYYFDGRISEARAYQGVLDAGAVAALASQKLLGRWKLDETTGTHAADASNLDGNGQTHDATFVGGSSGGWVSDAERGRVIGLDGTDDYLSVGVHDAFKLTGALTLSAWVRPDSFGAFEGIMGWVHHTSSDQSGYTLHLRADGQLEFGVATGSGGGGMTYLASGANNTLTAGQWAMASATYDGQAMRLYINGQLVAATPKTGDINWQHADTDGLELGRFHDNDENVFFHGRLDDARLYAGALTADDLARLYTDSGNIDPVAADDHAITRQATAVTIAALANDIDDETATLAVQSFTQPAHGSVVNNNDGTFTYTPNANYVGDDSFTYTIVDANGATATATAHLQVRGLVGHWTLSEGTGNTLADQTINTNNATPGTAPGSTPTWTAGPGASVTGGVAEHALDFDGSDDYVTVGTPQALQPQSQLTLAAWVNVDQFNDLGAVMSWVHDSGANESGYALGTLANGHLYFALKTDNGSGGGGITYLETDSAVRAGQWNHVTATYDGAMMTLYINGQVVASTAKTGDLDWTHPGTGNDDGLEFGRFHDNDEAYYFDGQAADLRIYDRALDPAEVAAQHQALPNQNPVAQDVSIKVDANGSATINLADLGFDHALNDLAGITIATLGTPANGSVVNNNDGTLTYTPTQGFGATASGGGAYDSFTFTLQDASGATSSAATVHLLVGQPATSDVGGFTTTGEVVTDANGHHNYTLTITPGTGANTPDLTQPGSTLIITWGDDSFRGQPNQSIGQHGNWGPDITDNGDGTFTAKHRVADPAQVQHIQVKAKDATGKTHQAKVTVNQTPVYDIDAEALSPSEVFLRWRERMTGEYGYRIKASTDQGSTFTTLLTTAANATSALLTGLTPDTSYQFQIEAVVDGDQGFEAGPAAGNVVVPALAQGAPAAQWWLVSVDGAGIQRGESAYALGDNAIQLRFGNQITLPDAEGNMRTYRGVLAGSAEAAIRRAVVAAVEIEDFGGTTEIYRFPDSNAFDVGTNADLQAKYGGYSLGNDNNYRIVLEDTIDLNSFKDNDHDDWYWDVSVIPMPDQAEHGIDLDVDSLNDSGFTPPADNNPFEDRLEDSQGKMIDVGHFDVDRDGIPDYADGFDGLGGVGGADAVSQGEQFVPILIRIPEGIDPETATVTFTYSANDPAGVTATPVPLFPNLFHFSPGAGHLRIWTKDGSEARHKVDDFIGSGASKQFSDLPTFNGNADPRVRILYVEGVQTNGVGQQLEQIAVEITNVVVPAGTVVQDAVLMQLQDPDHALVDLDVDSDNLGGLQGDDAEEAVEESGGKITALSIQDLNGNSIPDFADSQGIAGLEFAEMALELRPPVPQIEYLGGGEFTTPEQATEALLAGAKITFEYDYSQPFQAKGGSHSHVFDPYAPRDGLLRIWKKNGTQSRVLSDFIESGVTYSGADLGFGVVGTGSQQQTVSRVSLWVEAVDATGENVPIKVTVSYGDYTRSDGTTGGPGGANSSPTQGQPTPPTAEYETESDIVYVRPGGVDLDIDSDNNGEYAAGDLAEDVLEDVGVGKVLVVATSDRDGNGVLDFTDGFDGASGVSGEHLVPLDLGLPEWIGSSLSAVGGDAWIVFNYDASDPHGWEGAAGASAETSLPPGNLRLWTRSDSRTSLSAASNGDFVANAQKSLSSFKLGESIAKTHFESHRIFLRDLEHAMTADGKLRLYVEAIAAPEDGQPLEIEVIFGTTFDLGDIARERDVLMGADTVRVTVVEPAAPFVDGVGLNQVGDGLDGGNPLLDAFMGPVRLDGQMASLVSPEISGDPFAWAFGHNRVWSNDPVAGLGAMAGPGHMIADLPFLVHGTSTMIAVFSPTNQLYFDRIADNADDTPDEYAVRFFAQDTLEVKTDNTIELTDSAGNLFVFHGYQAEGDNAVPELQRGKLKRVDTAGGHTIRFKYKEDGSGLLEEVTRVIRGDVQEKLAYEYADPIKIKDRTIALGDDHQRPILYQPSLSSVKLYRVEGAQETIVRSVVYGYYTGEEAELPSGDKPGRLGDLKTAEVNIHHDGSATGVTIDRTYYRYVYPSEDAQDGGSFGGSSGNSSGASGGGGAASDGSSKQDQPLIELVVMDYAAIARSGLNTFDDVSTEQLVTTHGATSIRTAHHPEGIDWSTRGLGENTSANNGADPDPNTLGRGGYDVSVARSEMVGPNAVRYTVTVVANSIEGHAAPTQIFELNGAREVLNHTITTGEGTWESGFTYDADGRMLTSSSPSGLTTQYKYYSDDQGDNAGRLHQVWIASDADTSAPGYRANLLTTYAYTQHEDVVRIDTVTEQGGGGGLPWTNLVTDFDYTSDADGNLVVTTTLPDTSATGGQSAAFTETFDEHGNLIKLVDAVNATHTFAYDPEALTLTTTSGGQSSVTHYDNLGNVKRTAHPDGTSTYYHIYQNGSTLEVTVQSGWPANGGAPLGNAVKVVTNLAAGTTVTTVHAPAAGQTPAHFGNFQVTVQGLGNAFSTTTETYDKGGRLIESITTGTGITTSPKTTYEYDDHGRVNKTHRFVDGSAKLTDEVVFDTLGRVKQLRVAEQLVQSFEYDNGGTGDGNITQATAHPGGNAPNRVTFNVYDWRNRLVASKQGHQGGDGEGGGTNRPAAVYFYDNLDQLYKTEIYDADGDIPSYDNATGQVTWDARPLAGGHNNPGVILERTDRADFDARGQVYQTRSIDPDTGYEVTTGLWYDALGQVIKQKAPGGLTTKFVYDALGQVTDVYLTDDASGNKTPAGDTILEHTHTDYDPAGNAIFTQTTQRNPSGDNRVTAMSYYYDDLGRLLKAVDHGVNLPAPLVRPDFAVHTSSSAQAIVTQKQYSYSAENLIQIFSKDANGVTGYTKLDGLGRVVHSIDAVGEMAQVLDPDEPVADNPTISASFTRWTDYEYDGLGRVTAQTIELPGDGAKTTKYIYDGLYLSQIQFPGYDVSLIDSSRPTQPYMQVYSFNALGQVATAPAASGAIQQVRQYDVVGRLIEARAVPGNGQSVIDTTGAQRVYEYDALGNAIEIGNEHGYVSRTYNAFGQVTRERHNNREYKYLYENASGGVRATGITYGSIDTAPDRTFTYTYAAGVDDRISRITSVKEGASELEHYEYLGLATPQVITTALAGSNDLVQTRAYDDFGRLENQVWKVGSTEVEDFAYSYDALGQLLSIDGNGTAYDQTLGYNPLGQLTGAVGGFAEDWALDVTGLHRSVEADGHTLSNQSLVRPMFHGVYTEGELRALLEPDREAMSNAGPGQTHSLATVQFDGWGRVTKRLNWDIENWLNTDGFGAPLVTWGRSYEYDAMGRLTELKIDLGTFLSPHRRHRFYHDIHGNILEERVDHASGNGFLSNQYTKLAVWSPVTGDLILEDHDTDGDHVVESRYVTLVDVQGNTVAVLDHADGSVASRYRYAPSGQLTRLGGSSDPVRHLYRQGWMDVGGTYNGTVLRGGLYYDALENGVLRADVGTYWAQRGEPDIGDLTLFERNASAVVEVGHLVLDGLGLIPVAGFVFDLANAGLYYLEGRHVEAGISGFAAIPAVGYFGLGAQVGKYGVKATGVLSASARASLRNLDGVSRGVGRAQRDVLAGELRVLRGELQALRANGAASSAILNKQREIYGTIYGVRRMWQRGYRLEGSLRYGTQGYGLDLIFRARTGGDLAVLEAKAGRGAGSRLATDASNLTQGSVRLIRDRARQYLDRGLGNNRLLAEELLNQVQSRQVRSFASFLGSRRLYQVPSGWPEAGRLILRRGL